MKRVMVSILALLIAIPLAVGVMAGLAYYTTTETTVPSPTITVMDEAVSPAGFEWYEPVFGGMFYRDFKQEPGKRTKSVGELADGVIKLEVPDDYTATVTIFFDGEEIWSGDANEVAGYQFKDNGTYQLQVDCTYPQNDIKGYGTLSYVCRFSVLVEPRMETSEEWVNQGDMVAVRVYNLPDDVLPEGESDLGPVHFVSTGDANMTAFVPVGHDCEPGAYGIRVSAGDYDWEASVRVIETSFPVQNVNLEVLDPENPPPTPTDNPDSARDWQETIWPLLEVADDTQYWFGNFMEPVKGRVMTAYGLFTHTNTDNAVVRHHGMDFQASRGTDIIAPNSGMVIFAGNLGSSGNTVVIAHGAGLKSLFYYMDEIQVEEGDIIDKGKAIGTVGGDGLYEGDYLHYEVRLFTKTVNPQLLFNGTSKLFYFDSQQRGSATSED